MDSDLRVQTDRAGDPIKRDDPGMWIAGALTGEAVCVTGKSLWEVKLGSRDGGHVHGQSLSMEVAGLAWAKKQTPACLPNLINANL